MRKIAYCITGALLLAVLAGAPAGAQTAPDPGARPGTLADKTLEDLLQVEVATVFGASKREQRVTEAPSSVTILTAEEIRTFGWRTLAEALSAVRGFYTTNDRNYTYLGARGFGLPSDYNNRILVLVDGHRLNDNVYDQALIGWEFPIDLALVDRIEIIRGPGSALYGTSAFFAVVNVTLRRGAAVGGSESSVEAGGYGGFRVRASYGGRTPSGVDAILSVTRMASAGADAVYFPEYDDAATGFGVSRHADGEDALSVFGSLSRGRFALQGAFGSRDKVLPTGSYGTTFGVDGNRTTDSRGWLDASMTGALHGLSLTGRAFADYSGYAGVYMFDEGALENRDTATGVWAGAEVLASTRLGRRHHVVGGIEYRRNFRQDQDSWDVEPHAVLLSTHRRSHHAAVYAQDEIELHRRLTATVGGRYDWWGELGGTGRPRFGLVYRTDADTAVKALFGAAYRAPTVYETFYYPDPSSRPLRPETVQTSEIVYEQYMSGGLRVTATGYLTKARNLIAQQGTTETVFYANSLEANAAGLEVEAERRWANGVLARASVALQQTRNPATDLELSNSPRHLGLLNLAVPVWSRRATIALESQFVGSRLTNAGARSPGAWLAHLNVSLLPRRHPLSLSVRVANLFDSRYAHPVGFEFRQDVIPQDGRMAFVRATLRL